MPTTPTTSAASIDVSVCNTCRLVRSASFVAGGRRPGPDAGAMRRRHELRRGRGVIAFGSGVPNGVCTCARARACAGVQVCRCAYVRAGVCECECECACVRVRTIVQFYDLQCQTNVTVFKSMRVRIVQQRGEEGSWQATSQEETLQCVGK